MTARRLPSTFLVAILIGTALSQRYTTVQSSDGREGLTDNVINTLVTNQQDALNLLSSSADRRNSTQSYLTDANELTATEDQQSNGLDPMYSPASTRVAEEWCSLRHQLSTPIREVLDVWKTCPFVLQRWMTAQEAVSYIDLFFKHMAPMSAVVDEFFCNHSNHHILIKEEPVLCCTILALSSRYHSLVGEGGLCRGFLLHDRLWKHCQSLFHKVIWGQERKPKGNTRALGTIESLLLVTEWHPRSLHQAFDVSDYETDGEMFRVDGVADVTDGL